MLRRTYRLFFACIAVLDGEQLMGSMGGLASLGSAGTQDIQQSVLGKSRRVDLPFRCRSLLCKAACQALWYILQVNVRFLVL